MSDCGWPEFEKHPLPSVLLLFLERELGSREAALVERHIAECWECRAESKRLQRGICGFIEYRQQVLIPELPPPPASRDRFHARLLAEPANGESRLGGAWRSLHRRASGRLPWVVAAAAAAVAAFMIAPKTLSPPLGGPPVVSAAEFLEHVRRPAEPLRPGPRSIVYQRVEIRHQKRVYHQEVLRGTGAKPRASVSAELPELPPVDWADPLGAEQFVSWRQGLPGKRDSVASYSDRLTLTTAVLGPSDIVSASLTVRGSDWHAVSKTVELRGGDSVEIREVAYELRPMPELPRQAIAASGAEAPLELQPLGETAIGANELSLDTAEIDLREAFHRIGADLHEAPRIWRENGSLHFSAWVESEARAADLRQAAAGVPHTRAELHTPEASVRPAPVTPPVEPAPVPQVTRPPLIEQLSTALGGIDAANRYLDDLGTAQAELLAAASSLARLAERYPETEQARLPAALAQRVERLADDEIARVRRHAHNYTSKLSPVLAEMLAQQKVAVPMAAEATGCGVWQTLAPAIAADSRSLHLSFRRLFVQEQTDQPVSFSAPVLLRQAAVSRAGLLDRIGQLCVLAGAAR